MKELSIVLRHGFATFGSATLDALGKVGHLRMETEGCEISFSPSDEGIAFFREVPEGRQLVLRAGRDVVKAFEAASGREYDKKAGTKYVGEMINGKLVFSVRG